MRISTAFYSQRGITNIIEQQNRLSDIQEQIATGKRIIRPSDDPTAASQILRLEQSVALTDQYQRNADIALNRLKLEESTLDSVQDSLLRIREIAIQGANSTLGNTDRLALSQEVRERLNELLSLANTRDANQEYLFSGYKVTSKPFSESASGAYIYSGDQGQRSVQISTGRQIADSDTGNDVFVDIRNGNGTFKIEAKAGNVVAPGVYTPAVSDGSLAVQNDSNAGGVFNTVNLGVGQTYSLTVGGVLVYSETDGGGGTDTVTAAEVDAGLTAQTAALNAAGITFTGTVAGNDLVFSRVDGAAFNIDVVNDTGVNGFAGADFATGTNTINNGSVASPVTDTAFTMSIDGTQFYTEAAGIGATVTAAELDAAIAAFVAGSGGAYTIESGSIAAGNLLLSKADGTPVALTIDSNFSGTAGAFSGALSSSVNTGTATFNVGQLIDPTAYTRETYTINFVNNGSGDLAYNVIGSVSGQLLPPTPQDPVLNAPAYVDGASIQFNGIQTGFSGTPVVGDVFTITPSTSQDMFTTVQNLVNALETSVVTDVDQSEFFNAVNTALSEIDLAFDNVTSIRTGIGARLKTIEDQVSVNEDFKIEMVSTLSQVRDLDFAQAVGELQSRLTSLEAAQATYTRIQNLSLFNFLN